MSAAYGFRDLRRCLFVSVVVGTILVSINQGPGVFLAPPTEPSILGRVGLNYVVPFAVASLSTWMSNRVRARERPGTKPG